MRRARRAGQEEGAAGRTVRCRRSDGRLELSTTDQAKLEDALKDDLNDEEPKWDATNPGVPVKDQRCILRQLLAGNITCRIIAGRKMQTTRMGTIVAAPVCPATAA
jgi:hypothetical protein